MRILVCGARDWADIGLIYKVLGFIHREYYIDCIIEGDARGADRIAGYWARKNGIDNIKYPAKWEEFGKAAGPIRNREQIKENPDLVIAFHYNIENSKGTKDMIKVADINNIKRIIISQNEENLHTRLRDIVSSN